MDWSNHYQSHKPRVRSSRPSTRFSIPPQIFDFNGMDYERPTICDVPGCCRPWVKIRSGADGYCYTRQHLCIEHRDKQVYQHHPGRRGTMDWEIGAQRLFLQEYHQALWLRLVQDGER